MRNSERARPTALVSGLICSVLGAAAARAQEALPVAQEAAPAVQEEQPQAVAEEVQAEPLEVPAAPTYHRFEEVAELLSAWLASGVAETLELGASCGGRPLLAIQFGGQGPTPLDQRATILLLGGLDGVSLAGAEAVLAVTHRLLDAPEGMPPDVTFVAIPWANPDGLSRWLELGCGGGRNERPTDDDHDGRLDEDGPDDMDGDQAVVELLIEDPEGDWARCTDGRFLRPARAEDGERFLRVPEGQDEDGDGRFNEDGLGGVVLDHNFPVGWRGPWSGWASGPHPLSEPGSTALARFALGRRTAAVLVFQGNHGKLAAPGGLQRDAGILRLPFAEDESLFEQLGLAFAHATRRAQPQLVRLQEARGREHPGAAVDWFYAALGALAMEVGVWGPEVQAGLPASALVREGRFPLDDEREAQAEGGCFEHAWARWLDDTRGGIGFVDWQPAELGEGRRGWIGGWDRHTCTNPPPEVLPRALEGLADFVLVVARDLPRLRIELREAERDGRIAFLRARIHNEGRLASGLGPAGAAGAIHLQLVLPEGVTLVAGELEIELPHLPAGGRSFENEWVLVAPEGSTFRLEVSSPWSPVVFKEVRL